jgi:transposase
MLDLTFTDADIEALRTLRFAHPHPCVQRKMEAVLLRSQGVKQEHILPVCQISKATYFRYLAQYQAGGVEALKQVRSHKPQSQLQEHRASLEAYFLAHPPATVGEACAVIKEWTGLERQPTQVRQFLHSLGLKPRKVGAIPAKADVEAQETFRKNSWSRV